MKFQMWMGYEGKAISPVTVAFLSRQSTKLDIHVMSPGPTPLPFQVGKLFAEMSHPTTISSYKIDSDDDTYVYVKS